jgi:uncharacterized membrane protein
MIAPSTSTCKAIRENIEAVRKMEEEFARRRTLADRVADVVGGFGGSLKFVAFHAMVFGCWILWNTVWGPRKFDPYPFMLLSLMVNLEAIFLSTFVLMKQNRMSKREDLRAHLDLQINLLSEREMTLVLQLLQRISTRLGVRLSTREIEELSSETSVEELASQLRETLPED